MPQNIIFVLCCLVFITSCTGGNSNIHPYKSDYSGKGVAPSVFKVPRTIDPRQMDYFFIPTELEGKSPVLWQSLSDLRPKLVGIWTGNKSLKYTLLDIDFSLENNDNDDLKAIMEGFKNIYPNGYVGYADVKIEVIFISLTSIRIKLVEFVDQYIESNLVLNRLLGDHLEEFAIAFIDNYLSSLNINYNILEDETILFHDTEWKIGLPNYPFNLLLYDADGNLPLGPMGVTMFDSDALLIEFEQEHPVTNEPDIGSIVLQK